MNIRVKATLLAALMTLSLSVPALANETPPPTMDLVIAKPGSRISVSGPVEYQNLEGGFYSVDGWGLMGDDTFLKTLSGQTVIVEGKEFDGISTRMVKSIVVSAMMGEVKASTTLSSNYTVNGKAITFDQAPRVVEGTLMLPLRAIAEAAGGTVSWNAAENSVHISLSDRDVNFYIGKNEAELNKRGVMYIRRNLLPLTKTTVVVNGRTMIAADAATQILGLYENLDQNNSLDLVVPAK